MTEQAFDFRIGKVVRHWEEKHEGITYFYVEHIRDGQLVTAYSNYADPLESKTKSPLERASSADTATNSPLVSK